MSTASPLLHNTQDRCIHKLPTACRLTATQNCCACSDRRPHSTAYSIYIDGLGLVDRGTRSERYCWPCKEFWNERLEASNPSLRPTQTRIPDIPDQSDFLRTWYDVQRGYRIIRNESGEEERVPLHASIRDGRIFSTLQPQGVSPTFDDLPTPLTSEHSDSPPSALDSDSSLDLERHSPSDSSGPNPVTSLSREERERQVEEQSRRVSSLRSELLQIRVELSRVVSDLEALGTEMDSGSPTAPLPNGSVNGTITNDGPAQAGARDMQLHANEAQRRIDQIRQNRDDLNAVTMRRPGSDHYSQMANRDAHLHLMHRYQDRQREWQDARRNLNHLRSESRTAQNFSNVFGTREEVERLGDDYQSPVGSLFMSAYGAYGRAEDHRRGQQQALDAQMGQPTYPPMTPLGQPSEMWETLNHNGDPMAPPNPHASMFGPSRDPGANSPRYSPGSNVPGPMSAFLPSTYCPYIPGTSPYALPPLASHYGTNYSAPPSATAPGTPGGQVPSADFNPERAFYDRVNRPYGGREAGAPAGAAHMPTYPSRPPDMRGPREFTSVRSAAQHYAHRLERRHRLHDSENSDYHYDLLDEMEYEDSLRETPKASENCVKGLDNGNDGRPEPKTEEEMTINLQCKVCFSQIVDTILLPCGHAVMCQWCANQHVPTPKHGDKTRPLKPAKCPMCRKAIKQKVRMHIG